jgi:redox-sensitive bicupin YhaK (pirin superfamily)
MSWIPEAVGGAAVELVVEPSSKDLGGFSVRRALPSIKRRMVGPFVFFDHMGPALMQPGEGLDVRPHPHIGLATLTYLTEGRFVHRDSLGSLQEIRPGEVNWMTAGRGIAHSERTGADQRASGQLLQGLQSWIALPRAHEETAPFFAHHAVESLPYVEDRGVEVRLIVGRMFGQESPVATFSDMFYADAVVAPGAKLPLPVDHAERAVYVLSGEVSVAGDVFGANRLLVFRPEDAITIVGVTSARLLLLGGAPMDGDRHLWWNFVSSSKERIEAAKLDWKEGRFGVVPDDPEYIPLPS